MRQRYELVVNLKTAKALGLGERSGAPSGLRPASFVMSDTPLRFNSAGCLNYPCRTPKKYTGPRDLRHKQHQRL